MATPIHKQAATLSVSWFHREFSFFCFGSSRYVIWLWFTLTHLSHITLFSFLRIPERNFLLFRRNENESPKPGNLASPQPCRRCRDQYRLYENRLPGRIVKLICFLWPRHSQGHYVRKPDFECTCVEPWRERVWVSVCVLDGHMHRGASYYCSQNETPTFFSTQTHLILPPSTSSKGSFKIRQTKDLQESSLEFPLLFPLSSCASYFCFQLYFLPG